MNEGTAVAIRPTTHATCPVCSGRFLEQDLALHETYAHGPRICPNCGGDQYECRSLGCDEEALCERCDLPVEPHAAGTLAFSHCPGWKYGDQDWAPSVRPATPEWVRRANESRLPVRVER